ncbi:DUF7352 domain-containing protein [Streptomyces cylindrosporus]|uniref:DUF7352 domain-containing protein n=1 Tax=Streptomyces cylindrosporus TaxID=2927583 RepID=A0ABS9YQF3_9ACTN|nr:hypothetical protein [Streptomyces cylindrosporus]MCI3279149.1 hypothetical protein [Streptomyces cylindrosporus]
MTTDTIHRAELPIDDRPHGIDLSGDILHAAVRRFGSVDVWYVARRNDQEHMRRSFQIVGTGQPFAAGLHRHHKSAVSPDSHLVWHVLENLCPHSLPAPEDLTDHQVVGTECPACRVGLSGKRGSGWVPV